MFRRLARTRTAAWQLIEFLSQPDVQRRFHALTGDLPPRRSALGRSRSSPDDPYARAFREQLERVKPTPKVPEWERIAQEMQLVAERVVHGGDQRSTRRCASSIARADAILEKRRWMLAREGAP